jgi:hypothetical protein
MIIIPIQRYPPPTLLEIYYSNIYIVIMDGCMDGWMDGGD